MTIQDEIKSWWEAEPAFREQPFEGLLRKIEEEVKEVQDCPQDGFEIADLIICCYILGIHQGYDIELHIREKMSINRKREWVRLEDGRVKRRDPGKGYT